MSDKLVTSMILLGTGIFFGHHLYHSAKYKTHALDAIEKEWKFQLSRYPSNQSMQKGLSYYYHVAYSNVWAPCSVVTRFFVRLQKPDVDTVYERIQALAKKEEET
jgi:hypothetical protein